jgi:Leucine-rich repeat (LRR) protein
MGKPFMNLKSLELASCGLDALTDDFGRNLPNLQFLNLNHNALKDLTPMLGIVALEELHLVDNRLNRLRRTTAIMAKLGKALKVLDCRNNPITLGFYASESTQTPASTDLALQIGTVPRRLMATPEDVALTAQKAHLLPLVSEETEDQYQKRLDEETKFRRKVYELLLITGCKELKTLDGMGVAMRRGADKKATMKRLIELGVLKRKSDSDLQ